MKEKVRLVKDGVEKEDGLFLVTLGIYCPSEKEKKRICAICPTPHPPPPNKKNHPRTTETKKHPPKRKKHDALGYSR